MPRQRKENDLHLVNGKLKLLSPPKLHYANPPKKGKIPAKKKKIINKQRTREL
jgi:hypothetical protein